MYSISVVIPVFNSAATLEKLYHRLCCTLDGLTGDYELIFVDDGSRDSSFAGMSALQRVDPRVKAIRLKKNYGQQNAIMCGLHYAKGDYTVIMDDDLENPPEEIAKLLLKILEGYEVVYGIPDRKFLHPYRCWGAVMRDLLFDLMFRKPREIKVTSFRIMDRRLVERIIQDKTSFVYISAITFREKVRAANVKVKHARRECGGSNYSWARLAKLFANIFLNYSPLFSRWADTSRPQFELAQDGEVRREGNGQATGLGRRQLPG